MLKILSSEYLVYACGKNFSHAMILNENTISAKGSSYGNLIIPRIIYSSPPISINWRCIL
jgi:hypothetical protein